MSARRAALAVAAGTATLFVWGAVSHMIVIRGVGFSALPDDSAFAAALVRDRVEPGLYAFPAPPFLRGEPTTEATMTPYEARFREGPSGLLVVRPPGTDPVSGRKLLVQLAAHVIAALVATDVARGLTGRYLRRAAQVGSLGLVGLTSVGVILWNWYAFTDGFFAALCLDVVVGWVLVGFVVTAVVPARPTDAEPVRT